MQTETIPKLIRQRAKLVRAPKLCRPPAAGIQDRISALGAVGSRLRLEFVFASDRDGKLEIRRIIWHRDPERCLNQRQILPNHMGISGNRYCLVNEETAGRLAQCVAGKAIDALRSRKARSQ